MVINTQGSTYKNATIMAMTLLFGGMLAGCGSEESDSDAPDTAPAAIEAEVIETEVTENNAAPNTETETEAEIETEAEPTTANESDAISLSAGQYVVGDGLPEGRYVIESKEGGRISIERDDHIPFAVLEAFADETLEYDIGMGIPSLTYSLKNGTHFELQDTADVTFSPVTERSTSNVLTPGSYEVGTDIAPGTYQVTSEDRLGKVAVYEALDKMPVYIESLHPDGEIAQESYELTLEEGQTVYTMNSPALHFDPVN